MNIKGNIKNSRAIIDPDIFVPLLFILFLIAFVNSLQTYFMYFKGVHSILNFSRFLLSKLIYSIYFMILAVAVLHLSKRLLLTKRNAAIWISVHAVVLSISLLIHQGLSYYTDKLILSSQVKASFGSLIYKNPAAWLDILVYVLFLLWFYLAEYKRKDHENEVKCSQAEEQLLKSKLQELRSRIHPQFLFNTLDTISNLVNDGRNTDANQVLELLSDFLRTTVYDNEREIITLEEEITFLNRYLEIERIRLKDNISITENISADAMKAAVPNFILQPITEEAVSSLACENIKGELKVAVSCIDGKLEIRIESNCKENFPGISSKDEENTVINIARARLLQLYGHKHALDYDYKNGNRKIISITIPYEINDKVEENLFIKEKVY